MVHPNKRSRGCKWVEDVGEGSDHQPKRRRRHSRLGVKGAGFLLRLRKKLKALAFRRAVRRELARVVDDSGVLSNLVRKQVQRLVPKQVERLVQKEAGRFVLNSVPSNSVQSDPRLPTNPNSVARYRLQFQNDIPEYLYTYNKVKSKDGEDVGIAIFDTVTKSLATASPWSDAEVKVVVLDGDVCLDRQERRAGEAFREHLVKSRKGKGELLLGEVVIKLEQGVGRLTDITFTDISARTRSGKFRLGLRLHQNEDTDVGEGMSDLFRVKDRRGKGNQKHHPPLLKDEVHYLDKIRKNGPIHNRLVDGGISTAQQLLRAYHTDPENLRRLIGGKRGVAQGTWEAIIKHARDCRPGDELYSYDITEQGVKLIFNSIFQLQGVYCGDTHYETSVLTFQQQSSLQSLKEQAFQNLDKIKLFIPAVTGSIPNPPQQTFPSSAQETSSFIMQHPSGDWHNQIMSTDVQCDISLPEVLRDLTSIQLSPEFAYYQEATFYSGPANGQMNHLSDQEEDINMFFEYMQGESVRRWVRLIAGLKCVILIDKYLAIRRSGKLSFNMPSGDLESSLLISNDSGDVNLVEMQQ